MQELNKFDIRNHTDKLEPAKEKNKYICPVCENDNLSISPQTGAYQCFNGCDCKDIREAIRPWAEVIAERNGDNYKFLFPKNSKPQNRKKPQPVAIPGDFKLVILDEPATDIPQPQPITSNKPKEVSGYATQTVYPYSFSQVNPNSLDQWVVRYQWAEPSEEKGYKKTFRQFHRLPSGNPEMKKGDKPWGGYRLEEAITFSKHIEEGTAAILQHEGEGCVEIGRENGLAGFTFQGSAWDKKSIIPEYKRIKDSGIGLIVFLHDADDAGLKKLNICQECANEVGIAFLGINPHDICPDLPYESSDIKEILGQMAVPEFIEKLEKEIHAAVEARQEMQATVASVKDDESVGTNYNQKAFHALYGNKNWICIDDKLYLWMGTYYKLSPDSVEFKRITKFCDSYFVEDDEGRKTYPHATPQSVKKVLEWAKLKTAIDPDLVNPPGVNCTNGVLRIIWDEKKFTVRLDPHTPDDYYTYKPLIEYNPNADTASCEQLFKCLDKPQQEIFLRIAAASLDLETVRQYRGRDVKAILAIGLGSNGKDALRRTLSCIYGEEKAFTSCSLQDFQAYDEGKKFNLYPLRGSRVNWASENAQTCRIDRLQSLKLAITGDTLHHERKGKDHEEFCSNAINIFNLNETPSLHGVMKAIQDRITILEFRKTFTDNPDPNNPNEIKGDPRFRYDLEFIRTNVAPAFLNKMLEALKNLMEEGIDYECTTDAFQTLQKDNNHLFQFFEDAKLGYVEGGEMTQALLWDMLEYWYRQNDVLTIDDNGRRTWADQVRPSDKNVKASNQVIPRIHQLFPKAVKGTKYCPIKKRTVPTLKGIGIIKDDHNAIENTRTSIENTRTSPAPLPAPKTQSQQATRTTRTSFSSSQENTDNIGTETIQLPLPMFESEEYPPNKGAGGAEPLPDKENRCGEACGNSAGSPQKGAGDDISDEDKTLAAYTIASLVNKPGTTRKDIEGILEYMQITSIHELNGYLPLPDFKKAEKLLATETNEGDISF